MPASPIRKLVPYAEAAKKRGINVYHLNIGQPDIKTPQVALDAIHRDRARVLEYTHSAGIESTRRKLAEFYASRGIEGIDYNDIILTSGGSEAILFGMLAICDPGDQIIVPEPYYANYNGFAIEANVEIVPVKSYIEDNFALPPIPDFEKLITPRTRAIFICNPNNPTGYLYTEDELEQLKELVRKHDIFLFSDEVYSDLCYDGRTHHSALKLKGIDDNVVMFDSMSKRYSMCGIRIGAIVTRNRQLLDSALKMGQARLCTSYIGQVAAEAAMDAPQSYYKDVYDEYVSRRDYIINALQKIEGVVCPMPSGAFYAIVQLPVDDADRFAQWMLEEFDHNGNTVMIAPASGFYHNPEDGKKQARIAYVLNKKDLAAAVEALEAALKAYPNRTV